MLHDRLLFHDSRELRQIHATTNRNHRISFEAIPLMPRPVSPLLTYFEGPTCLIREITRRADIGDISS